MMETVLREACDNCHRRKTRCPTDGGGPCTNCRANGQVCTFNPRNRTGRPRVRPSRSKRNRATTPSLTQTDGDNNAGSNIPTVFDPVPGDTTPIPSIVLGGAERVHASLPDESTLASDPSYMHSPWESSLEPFPMSLTEPLIPFDNELPFLLSEEVDSLCKSPSQITDNEISQRDLAFLSPNKAHSVPRTTSPALAPERHPQQSYMEDRPERKENSLITVYRQLSQLLFTLHLAHDTSVSATEAQSNRSSPRFHPSAMS